MTSSIVLSEKSPIVGSIGDMKEIASALAASGYFKDTKDASQAFVKVLAGHELGIPPFAAMNGIHIIQGKPEVGANILASLVKSSAQYNYRVLKLDENSCSIEFYERWEGKWQPTGVSSFTIEDAKKAGTQNLQKFPRNMLFARALSNGVRWYCPDVTSGGSVYVEGELSGDYEPAPLRGAQVVETTPPSLSPASESTPFVDGTAVNWAAYTDSTTGGLVPPTPSGDMSEESKFVLGYSDAAQNIAPTGRRAESPSYMAGRNWWNQSQQQP